MRSRLAQTKLQAVKSTKAPDMVKARVVEVQAASDTYVVHKFGGTCVGSVERILKGAQLMINLPTKNKLLVVSAMGGVPKVTDLLLDVLAKAQARDPTYAEEINALEVKHVTAATELLGEGDLLDDFIKVLKSDIQDLLALLKAISVAGSSTGAFSDFVVGHGELWSAQMMSAVIKAQGGKSTWMDARQVLTVEASDESGQVEVDYEVSKERLDKWFENNPDPGIVVMTGFIAETHTGSPTTLKRNGSDYTATIIGNLLEASNITIWTDVDGVYSADPRRVVNAVCLESLSYNEAWELAYFGASVLHPQCTFPAMRKNIPVVIRNFFNLPNPGTAITSYEEDMEFLSSRTNRDATLIKGLATIEDVTLINVEGTGMVGVPGTASKVFESMRTASVNVVMISQASSEHSICFAVKNNQAKVAVDALNNAFAREINNGDLSTISQVDNQCILAAVGQGMCSTPGVSAILFSALAKANVNVSSMAQGCSEYNITVVVDADQATKALNAVHSRFYLSETSIGIVLVGPGGVGATFLDQLSDQYGALHEDFDTDLRVIGIASGSSMLADSKSILLDTWRENWDTNKTDLKWEGIEQAIIDSAIPNVVFIDCTASEDVGNMYEGWLRSGYHVITPNKKAGSGDLAYYQRIRSISRTTYTHFFAEATVGAGLPILNTVHLLTNTGDPIQKIEGILSGTLSYIFNNYDGSMPFSEVVKQAKELGYTEPDPRDDLSGTDVARKVVILAREAGLNISMEDVPVESLVPAELMECSIDEYMAKLPDYDQQMADKLAEAASRGEVLRFVGVVDRATGKGGVELKGYTAEHPFGQLNGSDNMVCFHTKRYNQTPLVVRGPGAGAEVTAGGVFADLFKLSAYLGAPS